MNIIDKNKTKIEKLCRKYNVKFLYTFGSVLSDSYTDNSDIDFLVDFNDINIEDYADTYFNLKFALIDILKRDIDLLEARALDNPFLINEIDNHKKLVYGKAN